MKFKIIKLLSFTLILALLATMLPACSPVFAAESYMALIPEVLHSGQTEEISLALFNGENPASGNVEVVLLDDGKEILKTGKRINGKGTLEIKIPDVADGEYEIRVKSAGFEDKASVSIEKSFLTLLETDKPIYKPGQTIHIRLITLDNKLMPLAEQVVIEVLDAKGIKIFRSESTTDEYGMASLELPLSTEPNLGVWKITATTDNGKTQLDVRVEEYVLPKYEINVDLPKQWFLVSEAISGSISAEYSFGKPVSGEIEIIASRYVGEWEEYAIFTKSIDGDTNFEIPAVGYVVGTPAAGGLGNIILDVIVRETATGYEEKTSVLLTVAETKMNIQIIPESVVFKPGLPFNILFITETPANEPLDAKLDVSVTYLDAEYNEIVIDKKEVDTDNGTALLEIKPPDNAVAMIIETFELTPISSVPPAEAEKIVTASYSPSSNFIHLEQISQGIPEVGEQIIFKVNSTKEAANFYYEVIARGSVVFSDFTSSNTIAFDVTPLMAPSARLLVYQILPNSEVAADYLPFKVTAEYPHDVTVEFSDNQAAPGDEIEINIETDGEAKVGITVVDKSVYILAENRLNLQQVFDELERLYMQPQVELHEATIYPAIITQGARDVFEDSGMIILSNNDLPQGEEYKAEDSEGFWDGLWRFFNGGDVVMEAGQDGIEVPGVVLSPPIVKDATSDLAEIERVRQFFPETWLWEEITVDADGKISVPVTVPDTITTWMLHAVAISKDSGLGMAEDELIAFQPFFIKVDLPYSAIRGEEFPVKIAVYNYLDEPQEVLVQIEEAGWFELLDDSAKTVTVAANDIGGVEFFIKPNGLGFNELKLTAQSTQAADAVIKSLLVQPEGVAREFVENLVLAEGMTHTVDTGIPEFAIDDSGRVYIAITSSFLTQTIEGLEGLIQMPFGCGEQNMIVFAPDVYITKYLKESGQLKPEIMAKAEKLMITGYQRELTYRRSDGSFSAFGESDAEGSLWLTAFVLKSFAEAEDLIYIDSAVLQEAADWLISQQNSDGSFEPVGFVHHQELLGGVQGKNALTAYTAIALMEAGENSSATKAITYLEGVLDGLEDPYTLAITAYALELGGSNSSDAAYAMLMELAIEDENGLHWSSGDVQTGDNPEKDLMPPIYPDIQNQSADIEITAYATLMLVGHGDAFNASRAAKWLVSQRNAYGGYGSTQDTVMALQALIQYSSGGRADVDLTVTINTSEGSIVKHITSENFDVLQIIEVPVNDQVVITVEGEGEAIAQVVKRFNLPQVEEGNNTFDIKVDYDTTEVEVNDLVTVSVELGFNPPQPMEAGMIVLDISIPTGFVPVMESIAEIAANNKNIKRYDIAGRKVIFYIENMQSGDSLSFSFQVRAEFSVKAKGVTSQVYSYYQPELRGEILGEDVTVH
ncbi:alpha-2-macroglobulin family protein [Chloroflexota bacterium]